MASMDLGWTTATSKNASVWEGPKVWEGVDKNSMDFNSSLVAGNNWTTPAVTTHTTIVAPTVVTHAVWELGRDAELFEDSSVSNPFVAALLRCTAPPSLPVFYSIYNHLLH